MAFDWLKSLKDGSFKRNRRRSSTRKPIRNSAELLQVRTMLSGTALTSNVETDDPADDDHDHNDHDHGDDSGSCGAHADDPTKAGEHCAAMALATPEGASHAVVASGDWSDAGTWQDGAVPTEGADVYVPAGMTLTVDGVVAETLHTIRIDGTLNFATDVNTEIKVDTIVGAPGSRLEIGTAANPVAADVTARIIFADGGEIDQTWDPNQLSRGAILHGSVEMFGAEKTAFTTLAEQPSAGATTLTLSEVPIGWQVGDELVIAGTDPGDPNSDEIHTIAAIDGTTITLNAALDHDHIAPAADLDVHVANNTRNIQLSSENSAELLRRGHVMFMHTLNVDVNYAGFYGLGRTDKSVPVDDYSFNDLDADQIFIGEGTNVRGRYSVHFHRGGATATTTPARVRGAVVAGNPGWGYVNHSSTVDFISNVAYDVTGSAFNNEAGNERGSYVGNIALRIVNPNDPLNSDDEFDPDAREAAQDFGFQGDGFWLQGAATRLENNVVAGNSGTAFFYWPEGLLQPGLGQMQIDAADIPNGELLAGREDQQINSWWVPVGGFQNNTAYNVGAGLEVLYLHTTYLAGDDDMPREYLDQLHSTFDGLTVWNTRGGALKVGYTERVTFSNIRLHGIGLEDQVGIAANQYQNQQTLNFENLTVDGFGIGMETPPQGEITISGSFSNLIDFYIENPQRTARTMNLNDITFEDLTAFDSELAAERLNFALQANFEVNDDKHSAFFLLPDRILLNFGELQGQALYFNEQAPDFVPMPSQPEDSESVVIAPEFLGKTNQQLFDEFGLSFGGALLPADANTEAGPGLENAQIGTAADPPTVFPPGGFPEDDEDDEEPGDEEEDEEPGDDEEEPGEDDEEPGDDEESDEEDDEGDPGTDDEEDEDEPGDDEESDDEPGDDEETDEEDEESDDDEEPDHGDVLTELTEAVNLIRSLSDEEITAHLDSLGIPSEDRAEAEDELAELRELEESEVGPFLEDLDEGEAEDLLCYLAELGFVTEDEDDEEDEDPGDDEEADEEDEEPGDDEETDEEDEEPGDDEETDEEDEQPGDEEEIDDDGLDPDDEEDSDEDDEDAPTEVTITLPSGASDVTIDDGDLVVTQDGEEVSRTSLTAATTLIINGTDDADSLIIDLRNGADLNLETISVAAGDGDDTVTLLGMAPGMTADVDVSGEGGNDLLIGSSGDEMLDGGDGHDSMIGGAGSDDLRGGAGNDVLIGNGGNDILDGGEGDDFARGDNGHDDITAGSGADVLLGRAGNDTIRFTAGIDTANGGAGSNVMMDDSTSTDAAPEAGGANVDLVIPDSGGAVSLSIQNGSLVVSQNGTIQRRITLDATDTITITGSDGADEIEIDFSRPGAVQLDSLTIDGQGGADQITLLGLAATLADSVIANGGLGNDVITLDRDIRESVTVNGGAGHDSITTARGRDIINGGDGNDFIDGGAQRDVIRGDRGHDVIFGRGGSDKIYGGSGFDTVNGNGGNDVILGNSGNDFLKGASGNDRLIGHGGDDVLRGDAGDDILQAGDGNDVLLGKAGDDALAAGAGDDILFGHNGNDSLAGGDGNDLAAGHNGDDIVMGEAGDDSVHGHGGNDVLTGGGGQDGVVGSEAEIDEDFTLVADWLDVV